MKYIPYLFSLLLLVSCGSESEVTEEKLPDNFSISGSIIGAENMSVTLEALSQNGSIEVAQGKIEANGSFNIKGNIPGMGIYQLRIGESNDKVIPLTLVEKDNVKIKTTYNDYMLTPNVSGTEWSSTLNEYMVLFATFAVGQQQLNAMQGKCSEDELMVKYLTIKKPLDDFSREKMTNDPDNPFNIILSTAATPTSGFKDWDPKNLDVLKVVSDAYNKRYKGSPIAATMENQLMQIESAYNEYLVAESGNQAGTTNESNMAPEIAMKNPEGKVIKLSSLRGKVVLLDFWASWCGPCRKESPNLVKLYQTYKGKDFVILSVSLDDDKNAWLNAIEKDGLIWTTHGSDLKGWETPLTSLYGFESIPHTVLVNQNGMIVGKGLRGELLINKIKSLF